MFTHSVRGYFGIEICTTDGDVIFTNQRLRWGIVSQKLDSRS